MVLNVVGSNPTGHPKRKSKDFLFFVRWGEKPVRNRRSRLSKAKESDLVQNPVFRHYFHQRKKAWITSELYILLTTLVTCHKTGFTWHLTLIFHVNFINSDSHVSGNRQYLTRESHTLDHRVHFHSKSARDTPKILGIKSKNHGKVLAMVGTKRAEQPLGWAASPALSSWLAYSPAAVPSTIKCRSGLRLNSGATL